MSSNIIYLWVALGGAIGSMARCMVSVVINMTIFKSFPYATLAVNSVGSYLIGLLGFYIGQKGDDQQFLRYLIITGFLGGLTSVN